MNSSNVTGKLSIEQQISGQPKLKRQIGIFNATLLGLGSILGTGVFVSIGISAGVAGPAVVLAIPLAALVALFNGMSSAQLAANHPVSGGTYEYGYKWLTPALGFTAGWMFLVAKSASAATAALGFASYSKSLFPGLSSVSTVLLAFGTVAALTGLVLLGIRRTSFVNTLIVSVTVGSLLWLILSGLPHVERKNFENIGVDGGLFSVGFIESIALMFVAYTGYGRIATLGEEIQNPRRNIPVSILTTLAVTVLLYVGIAFVAVGVLGSRELAEATSSSGTPLVQVARSIQLSGGAMVLQVGAITAMLGVLLNLILGLSRVVLAMGRRGDLFRVVTKIDKSGETPYVAILAVGVFVGLICLLGDLKLVWSFSAFTVLIYYSITNLCALRLTKEERLYSGLISIAGLCSCLFLAFWVEPLIWQFGIVILLAGLLWHTIARRFHRQSEVQ
ncbi:APC family permease [Thalassoglobus sp.]|uniref:APC family permease n=1 Tax=Thalassoglobus sp. TaxID=2795869 RepID=UPI003AA9B659